VSEREFRLEFPQLEDAATYHQHTQQTALSMPLNAPSLMDTEPKLGKHEPRPAVADPLHLHLHHYLLFFV
jgi:hypothetical protein